MQGNPIRGQILVLDRHKASSIAMLWQKAKNNVPVAAKTGIDKYTSTRYPVSLRIVVRIAIT